MPAPISRWRKVMGGVTPPGADPTAPLRRQSTWTNIHTKNQPPAIAQRVDALPQEARLCMSFITWAALRKGAERSTRKPEVVRRLEALARQVTVLYPAGPAICQHFAEQFTRLKDAGTPIGANELWIACHALAEDATLVTHNTREFQRIARLRLEDWVVEG